MNDLILTGRLRVAVLRDTGPVRPRFALEMVCEENEGHITTLMFFRKEKSAKIAMTLFQYVQAALKVIGEIDEALELEEVLNG